MSGPASPLILFLIGASTALFAANLYYAQPLLTTIASDLHIPANWAGSIISASQLGYGLGLFMLVPMADMVENRLLVLGCWFFTLFAIAGVAMAQSATAFMIFAACVGFFSSGAQILIPYLSHLLPSARRGQIVGTIMAGILMSVMCARPFALFIAATWGWRFVFWLSLLALFFVGVGLLRVMPPRQPNPGIRYRETISSMRTLFMAEAEVQRRTFYQALLFGTFTMFWAVMPIVLTRQVGPTGTAIGLLMLIGAGGVLAAPLAGRFSDKGATRAGTALASIVIACAFLLSIWSVHQALPFVLVAAAFVIDGSVQFGQVLSRMIVLGVSPEIRARVNGLYMTIVYTSGAGGSILGVSVYFAWGWSAVALIGSLAAFTVFAGNILERRRPGPDDRVSTLE